MRSMLLALIAATLLGGAAAGQTTHRIEVEVPPQSLGDRSSDSMPAAVRLDFAELLKLDADGRVDFATLRIVELAPDVAKETDAAPACWSRTGTRTASPT